MTKIAIGVIASSKSISKIFGFEDEFENIGRRTAKVGPGSSKIEGLGNIV